MNFLYLNNYAKPIKIQIILIACSCFLCNAQSSDELVLLEQKTDAYNHEQAKQFNNKREFTSSYNPLKLVGNTFLWVYQSVFSEQIMADCGFEPSCSSFAKEAIKERGLLLGVFLSVDRLTRCNGAAQIESEVYLVNKKTGKLRDEPKMYKAVN